MENDLDRDLGKPALCGFRNCRAPLPPPGPRGGRPFEFCPDRRWPGGKSCKQLAAAEQALREALGTSTSGAELRETTAELVRTTDGLAGPLEAVRTALDAVSARLGDEVTAAVTRAEEAEVRAAEADSLRQAAEVRAEEAEQTAGAAREEAQRHQQARLAAEQRANEAAAARKNAELAQARAEAAKTAAERQAADAAQDARNERDRAGKLVSALAERTEQLAERTAQRDAARESLAALQASSTENERALTAQLKKVETEHADDRARLNDLERQIRTALQEHRDQTTEAARDLAEARERAAALAVRLAESEQRHRAHTEQQALLQTKLANVHQIVLAPDDAADDLRARLLSELLSLPAVPAAPPRPATPPGNEQEYGLE